MDFLDYGGNVQSCYNIGEVSIDEVGEEGYVGGIVGLMFDTDTIVSDCYNTVSVTWRDGDYIYMGGIAGKNGAPSYEFGEILNSYCGPQKEGGTYCYIENNQYFESYDGCLESIEEIKGMASNLGGFVEDKIGINNGWPIFQWEIDKFNS